MTRSRDEAASRAGTVSRSGELRVARTSASSDDRGLSSSASHSSCPSPSSNRRPYTFEVASRVCAERGAETAPRSRANPASREDARCARLRSQVVHDLDEPVGAGGERIEVLTRLVDRLVVAVILWPDLDEPIRQVGDLDPVQTVEPEDALTPTRHYELPRVRAVCTRRARRRAEESIQPHDPFGRADYKPLRGGDTPPLQTAAAPDGSLAGAGTPPVVARALAPTPARLAVGQSRRSTAQSRCCVRAV